MWCDPVHLGPRLLVNWPPLPHPLPIPTLFQIPDPLLGFPNNPALTKTTSRSRLPGSGTVWYMQIKARRYRRVFSCFLLADGFILWIYHLHTVDETSGDTMKNAPALYGPFLLQFLFFAEKVYSTLWAFLKGSPIPCRCCLEGPYSPEALFTSVFWTEMWEFRYNSLQAACFCLLRSKIEDAPQTKFKLSKGCSPN
jgi:hypothetical protein